MTIDSTKSMFQLHIRNAFFAFVVLMATLNTCSCGIIFPRNDAKTDPSSTSEQSYPFGFFTQFMRNLNSNSNTTEILENDNINEQKTPRTLSESSPYDERKDFEAADTLNPTKTQQLRSHNPFGKSQQQTSYCSLGSTMGISDSSGSETMNQHETGGTFSQSSSASSSSSSNSSSSSFSSSNNKNKSHQEQSSANSQQQNAQISSPATGYPSISYSYASSSDDNLLPTNGDYYPMSKTETKSNDDLENPQPYDEDEESSSHTGFFNSEQKKSLARLIDVPKRVFQKIRKFHADWSGTGALYGSDHFDGREESKSY